VSCKARLANLLLGFSDAFGAWLQTTSAQAQARLGEDVRVFREGRIVNIFGDPQHVRIAPHARIRGELVTYAHAGKIDVGSWFYLGPGSMIWSSDDRGISIGDRVMISASVVIHDTNSHPMNPQARFEQTRAIFSSGHPREISGIRSAPIEIGDDVWIGAGVIVLKGVRIGHRAIIGAGALIAADVADDMVIPAGTVLRRIKEVPTA